MNHAIQVIQIYFHAENEKCLVGRLAVKNRQYYFEYDPAFLQKNIQLSPFKLPLQSGVIPCDTTIFEGIFGVFNDSLPDGWGRLLLDRKLSNMGIIPESITPLQRLLYVGKSGMGALSYEPAIEDIIIAKPSKNIDVLAQEIIQFQADNVSFLDDLLILNGSSAGARPKVMLDIAGEEWLIKFRSMQDPLDIGAVEFAYHLMAKACGMVVPEAKLFPAKKGAGYFGVKRFDRVHHKRIHMHSLSGLLHADHRIPSLDYESVLKATLLLTKNQHECAQQFRAAVFNVFAHNRDDHAKNFSFLLNAKHEWIMSPSYDLTFSHGPGGEHCTTVLGHGRNINEDILIKLANKSGIKHQLAVDIINEVKSAINDWNAFAKNAGVSKQSKEMIHQQLKHL